jgi:hypothetical protein
MIATPRCDLSFCLLQVFMQRSTNKLRGQRAGLLATGEKLSAQIRIKVNGMADFQAHG